MSEAAAFPRLRPEVTVSPFSSSAREKTYLLMHPDGRCLEVSRKLHELIQLLDGKHSLEQIAESLSRHWQTEVNACEVRNWIKETLTPHDLLELEESPATTSYHIRGRAASKRGVLLIRARWLHPVSGIFRVAFHPAFALPALACVILCHALFYTELNARALASRLGPSTWLAVYLVLLFSVLFHELGHLAACRHFDCPHGEIRFGLYLIFPVLYANVTPAWKLSRRQRMVVDLGGVYFQSILMLPAFLLLHLTGDNLWRVLFLELEGMLAFALNPFLRFDGYWLCSDLLGIPNLHARGLLLVKRLGRRLTRRSAADCRVLEVRGLEMAGLLLFVLGRWLFLAAIPILMIQYTWQHLGALPGLLAGRASDLLEHALHGDVIGLIHSLGRFLFLILLLLGVTRLLGAARRIISKRVGSAGRRCKRSRPAADLTPPD